MSVLDKVYPFLSRADASGGAGLVVEVEGGFLRLTWQSDVDGVRTWTIGRRTVDSPPHDVVRVRGFPPPYMLRRGDWGFDYVVIRVPLDKWA